MRNCPIKAEINAVICETSSREMMAFITTFLSCGNQTVALVIKLPCAHDLSEKLCCINVSINVSETLLSIQHELITRSAALSWCIEPFVSYSNRLYVTAPSLTFYHILS